MADYLPALLQFARFHFRLRFIDTAIFPPYKGAIFRGLFGKTLRKKACIAPRAHCEECFFSPKCLYGKIFEPSGNLRKNKQAPRPFILNPPLTNRQSFHPNDEITYDLVLIGQAIEESPYFIHVFEEARFRGLDRFRKKAWDRKKPLYELLQVDAIHPDKQVTIYERGFIHPNRLAMASEPNIFPHIGEVKAITLELLTPMRLIERGHLATQLSFSTFWKHLSHRLKGLIELYGNGSALPDFAYLAQQTADIKTISSSLFWYDWERYSYSQRDSMSFGGLKGSITFSGNLGPFMPSLLLAEQINVGQKTTFGLGRFQLTTHT